MKKKIIGYRLNELGKQYEKFAKKITKCSNSEWNVDQVLFGFNSLAEEYAEKAGVLNIWFEPVYAKEPEFEFGPVYAKEPEFEFGRWYHGSKNKLLFIAGKCSGYGFNTHGEWVNYGKDSYPWGLTGWTPATDEEVKERLLSYAKENYPVGTVIEHPDNRLPKSYVTTESPYFYESRKFKIAIVGGDGTGLIYADGKWAKIISKPKKTDEKVQEFANIIKETINKLEKLT